MRNPIASVPSDKRPMMLGGLVAAAILAMIFMLSPTNEEIDPETEPAPDDARAIVASQPVESVPQTRSAQPSGTISNIAGADSISTEADVRPVGTPAPAGSDDIYIEPPEMLTSEPGSGPVVDSILNRESVPASQPGASLTELELARELKLRLEQTEKRLQALQIQLNEQIQYAQKKANESQRWQDAVVQMEATMKKIIEDNNNEAEVMAGEIEHWRQQALEVGRENARLTERRTAMPAVATRELPPVAEQEPAPARPLPRLQLQTPTQPQTESAPQPAPQSQAQPSAPADFTTTCYDTVRGYFPCTVRQ
jgi:hypothetical protein